MNDNSILIDRYLQNEMSAEERLAFEIQLAADKGLQQELFIQQQINKAAERAGLKNEFAKAIKKKIINQRIIQFVIVVIIAVAAVTFFAIKNNWFSHTAETTAVEKQGSERFDINNAADTIIETKDGVVFAIPAHAFAGSDNVQLEIKTALTPYDIIQNGLSTVSNDALLQTAGMFSINGFDNGKQLKLVKDINVSVPAVEINPAMQLFDGVEDSNGHINWVNPKPVEKKLRTYDINTLDFYPPNYIPTLKALQKNYRDKRYTDSLYYSFSGYPHSQVQKRDTTSKVAPIDKEAGNYIATDTSKIPVRDSSISVVEDLDAGHYELDPARIKAIWNKQFNNTIIATKEFEERLHYMHSICYASTFFTIYLQNLNKPLYVSDELCAKTSNDEVGDGVRRQFLEFAARKDGSVIIAEGMQQKLSDYFQQKYTAYKYATAKTWEKYEAELTRLNNIAIQKRTEKEVNDFARVKDNYQQELCTNLTEAYKQIGVQRSCHDTVVPPAKNYYNVTINTPGWKNLDVYVLDATANRESTIYTDPITGKTAKLTYSGVNIQIENQAQYDKVLLYLIPERLSSFQRMEQEGNIFKEKLNSLLRYDAVALAYKGQQAYYYRQQALQPGSYVFSLSPLSDEGLRAAIKDYSLTKTAELRTEFEYQFFEQQEAIRQLQLRKDQEFREQVAASIFHCAEGLTTITNTPQTKPK